MSAEKTTTVTIRLDKDMKKDAEEIAKSFGINLPTAYRMFTAEIIRTRSIPVNLTAQVSRHFGLEGQEYMDFLLNEKRLADSGETGTEHELIDL